MSAQDITELNQLAYRYARAVDRCDMELFRSVFTPDARLRAYNPDQNQPFNDIRGHDQLVRINEIMNTMFEKTMHMMVNHMVEIDGERASGEVLCTARHLLKGGSDVLTIHIRYIDEYVRQHGAWKIADRQIRFQWAERGLSADTGF